jgi:hypothetical protein
VGTEKLSGAGRAKSDVRLVRVLRELTEVRRQPPTLGNAGNTADSVHQYVRGTTHDQ